MNTDSILAGLNDDSPAMARGNPTVETERDAIQHGSNNQVVSILLSQWKGFDGGKSPDRSSKDEQASLIRKLTVVFAVAKVLKHFLESRYAIDRDEIKRLCSIDNFIVNMRADELTDLGWEVRSVDVISLGLTVQISSNWVSSCAFFDLSADGAPSRNVEATIMSKDSHLRNARCISDEAGHDERMVCYLLGQFLHSFFCGDNFQSTTAKGRLKDEQEYSGISEYAVDGPSTKKTHFLSARENSTETRNRVLLPLHEKPPSDFPSTR